jgi:hypothetical protein
MLNLLKNAAPLSKEKHSATYLETGLGYDFARELSFVPVLISEIPNLIPHYTLAFLEKDGKTVLVALLGLKEKENLYIKMDGTWAVDYVPALLRQYPFAAMFGGSSKDRRGILCLVENYPGVNTEGKGVPLFNKDGEASQLVEIAQKLVSEGANGALETEAFCKRLKESGLLKPIRVDLKNSAGDQRRISGILGVDRNALNELPAEALKELQMNGTLELIYQQLLSLRSLRELASRIGNETEPKLN